MMLAHNVMQEDSAALSDMWKTSCFVWLEGPVANNDLRDVKHNLTEIEIKILSDLKMAPGSFPEIAQRLEGSNQIAQETLDKFVEWGLIVPAWEDEGRKFSVKRVDIETCTHCNARCSFCPQSEQPKPKHVMTLDLFQRVVRQIAPYRPVPLPGNLWTEGGALHQRGDPEASRRRLHREFECSSLDHGQFPESPA